MSSQIVVRTLKVNDFESITELSSQLGYTVEVTAIRAQITAILENKDHLVFVALVNNTIAAYLHASLVITLTSPPFYEIHALVVKDTERNKGIGKLLVRHLEENLGNTPMVRVRCNTKRADAHRFYGNLSFSVSKEQTVFDKLL